MDRKYDILRHPNVARTTDGRGDAYRHGEDLLSIVSVSYEPKGEDGETVELTDRDFLIFTEAEMEDLINQRMEEYWNEQEKQTKTDT